MQSQNDPSLWRVSSIGFGSSWDGNRSGNGKPLSTRACHGKLQCRDSRWQMQPPWECWKLRRANSMGNMQGKCCWTLVPFMTAHTGKQLNYPWASCAWRCGHIGAARYLQVDGVLSIKLYPKKGILPGCPQAPLLAKVVLWPVLGKFVDAFPDASTEVWLHNRWGAPNTSGTEIDGGLPLHPQGHGRRRPGVECGEKWNPGHRQDLGKGDQSSQKGRRTKNLQGHEGLGSRCHSWQMQKNTHHKEALQKRATQIYKVAKTQGWQPGMQNKSCERRHPCGGGFWNWKIGGSAPQNEKLQVTTGADFGLAKGNQHGCDQIGQCGSPLENSLWTFAGHGILPTANGVGRGQVEELDHRWVASKERPICSSALIAAHGSWNNSGWRNSNQKSSKLWDEADGIWLDL